MSRLGGIARALLAAVLLAILLRSAAAADIEGAVTIALSCLVGLINPVWALYALALFGPLYLVDPSANPIMGTVDGLALGAILGELRLYGRPDRELLNVTPGTEDPWTAQPTAGKETETSWGMWPVWLAGVLLAVAVSTIPGLFLAAFKDGGWPGEDWLWRLAGDVLRANGSSPEWPMRSALNWSIGAGLAVAAARRATPLRVARFLKFGGVGLVGACLLGVLDKSGALPLNELRAPNESAFQASRFQGTAGHAAWFGQWIAMFWVGIALWWQNSGRRRQIAILAGLLLVFYALLFSASRTAWAAVLLAVGVAGWGLAKSRPELRKKLVAGGVAAMALMMAVVFLGWPSIGWRFEDPLTPWDRPRFLTSVWLLLQEFPAGLGLGTFGTYYGSLFHPSVPWYSPDHGSTHMFWATLLVENGPWLTLLMAAGVVGLVCEARRGWLRFPRSGRVILAATATAWGSLVVCSLAQDFLQVRAIGYTFWVLAGLLLGLCRREVPTSSAPWRGRVLLAVSLAVLAPVTAMHSRRPYVGATPRAWEWSATDRDCSVWTPLNWSQVLPGGSTEVTFVAYRHGFPGVVRIQPDGGAERVVHLSAGESALLTIPVPGRSGRITLRLDVGYTPLAWEAERNPDPRRLGVRISSWKVTRGP